MDPFESHPLNAHTHNQGCCKLHCASTAGIAWCDEGLELDASLHAHVRSGRCCHAYTLLWCKTYTNLFCRRGTLVALIQLEAALLSRGKVQDKCQRVKSLLTEPKGARSKAESELKRFRSHQLSSFTHGLLALEHESAWQSKASQFMRNNTNVC